MEKEQLTYPTSTNEKWEITMSNKDKFIVNGMEYKAICKLAQSGNVSLVNLKDFSINISHIMSMVCIDKGNIKLPITERYKQLTDEQRKESLKAMEKVKENLFNDR